MDWKRARLTALAGIAALALASLATAQAQHGGHGGFAGGRGGGPAFSGAGRGGPAFGGGGPGPSMGRSLAGPNSGPQARAIAPGMSGGPNMANRDSRHGGRGNRYGVWPWLGLGAFAAPGYAYGYDDSYYGNYDNDYAYDDDDSPYASASGCVVTQRWVRLSSGRNVLRNVRVCN